MEAVRAWYPFGILLGHVCIVSFDIALAIFYHSVSADLCFMELKMWIYGQFTIHFWLSVVALAHLAEEPSPSLFYRGKFVALFLKLWWSLYGLYLFYSAYPCLALAPLLYGWMGGGTCLLAVSIGCDWGSWPGAA